MKAPSTLQQAILYFSDFENCQRFMIEVRWPDGKVRCPYCQSEQVTFLEKVRVWKCYGKHTRQKFSLKVGTVFEDSPIGLDRWFTAMWLIVNCKNGVSSYEIMRDLRVTQKTAWFMLQRIRLATQTGTFEKKLSGEVEADETFIGGLARYMHKDKKAKITGTGGAGKAIVMGILDRERGKVRVKHIAKVQRETLQAEIRKNVEEGSDLFTDAYVAYRDLNREYVHGGVDHAERYVNGRIHTNGLENFWSLLKRGLKGTYISVEPFHLFRYLDEQAFRYNNRRTIDGSRFTEALSGVTGRRLTYKHLTGKDQAQPDGPL